LEGSRVGGKKMIARKKKQEEYLAGITIALGAFMSDH
jgi:hypothetical protein